MGTKSFCCSTAGWELATPSTSHLGPPGAVEQHPDPRLASRLRAIQLWPAEFLVLRAAHTILVRLLLFRQVTFSCFLLPGPPTTCCHGCFCHHCAVMRPGLDPHTTLKSSSSSAQSAYSTAHGFPFVFNYDVVVGVLPSSSWCC